MEAWTRGTRQGARRQWLSALAFSLVLATVPFTAVAPAAADDLVVSVDSTGDESDLQPGDGACLSTAETCTLRAAIEEANAHPGPDAISFAITDAPNEAGEHVIQPGSPLPQIVDQISIDGTSQSPDSIVLDGSAAGSSFGLLLSSTEVATSAGSTVSGLTIRNFAFSGIATAGSSTSDGNRFIRNVIHGNGDDGIQIETDDNVVGGPTEEYRNAIHDNAASGVDVNGDLNTISHNHIGIVQDSVAAPNGVGGIRVTGSGNTIEMNAVSGNDSHGIAVVGVNATSNHIYDNLVGTSTDGQSPVPNTLSGVALGEGAAGNFIGESERPNTISGNGDRGVHVSSAPDNRIVGNRVGTDVSGTIDLGNTTTGIDVSDSAGTVIRNNVVSGNGGAGINLHGAKSTLNVISQNLVGLNASGDALLRNDAQGIGLLSGPSRNTVSSNVVSGNTAGIVISAISGFTTSNNVVEANLVGTNASGTVALGNSVGIEISASGTVSDNHLLENLISGNSIGISLRGGTSNVVEHNFVGTDMDGAVALGNTSVGISVRSPSGFSPATDNTIGPGNVVSGNGNWGIAVEGEDSTATDVARNDIVGNHVGTDSSGLAPIPNTQGILLSNVVDTSINGNVVSANTGDGIRLGSTSGTTLTGNKIGTDVTGDADLGNGLMGLRSLALSLPNTIGGIDPSEANTIAFNDGTGILVEAGARNLTISGNDIHSNGELGIDLNADSGSAGDGPTANDPGDTDTGGNDLTNFPELTAESGGVAASFDGESGLDGSTVVVELFSVAACDPSGFGEGDSFFARQSATADANGDVLVTFPDLPAGTYTATATAGGNTSEFSECVTVEAASFSEVLYGVDSGSDSLHIVDPATGDVTLVGPLDPDGGFVTPVAMAVHPTSGGLYVWNGSNPATVLATVDRCTGLAEVIGSGGEFLGALAFADDGTLYGLEFGLFQVEPGTGELTPIGTGLGARIAAADFAPDGTLYGVELNAFGTERLFTIDTDTGVATAVGTLSTDIGVIGSIAFAPDGSLLGSGSNPSNSIFEIDPATAAVSNFVELTGPRPQGMSFSASCEEAVPTVGFAEATSSALEGATHTVDIELSVSGDGVTDSDITIDVADAATGSATAGDDYTLDTAQVTFPAGSSDGAVQQVQVTIAADVVIESIETIDLVITAVGGAVEAHESTHTVEITDTSTGGSLGPGISFSAVDPDTSGGDDVSPGDGPPTFEGIGFIPFDELDPLAAVRADSAGAEEELESVGSGIAAIGSGIAAIGSGIAAIGSGIAAIGSGIAAIGSGIAAIGSGIAAIDIQEIGSGIAAIGSGIAAIDPPLSTIPITDAGDSWEQRLTGTVFAGAPLQSVTLSQVASQAPGALVGLTLGDVDYSDSAFGSLTLASVTVGNLTLGQALGTSESTECAALFGADAPANPCDVTVLAADSGGADLRSIGSGIAAIDISTVDFDTQPIGSTTIGAIGSGIAAIDLVFDCFLVDCSATSTVTLAEAQNLGALKLNLLGELFLLLLPVSAYDWTQMPVDRLQIDVGPLARYDLTFAREGTSSADTIVEVTLPAGVHYEPGTAHLIVTDGAGIELESSPLPDPTIDGRRLEWTISTVPGIGYQVSFGGRIDVLGLGVHRADAAITAEGVTLAAADAAPITIVENFEPNDSPSTAGLIDDAGLYISYLPDGTDEDYFTFGIPAGHVAKVLLHHLDDDFDLIYYEPTSVTAASTRDVSEFGPTTPPLDDEGRHTDDGALDQEAADDLDLESIGSGIAAIGSGIAAIGSNRGTEDESVEGTADDVTVGDAGIRVAGYNGSSSSDPYLLQLKFIQPFDVVCDPLGLSIPSVSELLPTSAPAGTDTLILWNASRTEALHGGTARTNMEVAIGDLVTELQAQGHVPFVLPVDRSATVRSAYSDWDENPCSATAANDVVTAINDLIDSYGLAPPQLTSITLIGGDVLVPYERRIDLTDIANERQYGPSLKNVGSGPQAGEYGALAGGWVLSNDAYAAFTSIYDWLGHRLYLPDVPIGRIVEEPDEIIFQIGQFVAANGILNPSTAVTDLDALVTGYDFLIDGASVQADALDSNYDDPATSDDPATDRSLIDDTWTADDLATALGNNGDPRDVIGLGAHFDHQRLFPAATGLNSGGADGVNYESADLLAETFAGSLDGRVIFSVGCHSGLTVPAGITLPGGGSTVDWAQTFSSVGAVFVGNSGFGYGLSDAVGLSEKLMQRFALRLDGSHLIGDALASAKREHFAQQLVYGPYDEKILAESTLFGFPFWRLTGDVDPTGDAPPGPPPGGPLQMSFDHTLVSTDNGSYYHTEGQSTELFHRPIAPQRVSEFLTTDGTRATGVVIRGITSRDETPFDPVYARPIFDLSEREPELETPGTIFPNVFASTSSRETPDGLVSTVALATGQFIGEGDGVQRLFTAMNVEVLFGTESGSAPEILLADAELSDPSAAFRVEVDGPADEVLVLYKPAGFDVGEVEWSTLQLTEESPGVWTGTVDGVSDQIEWFAQVRDGSFLSTSFNKGVLFAARLVDAGQDATVVEGDTYTLAGSFIDPDGSGPWTATIDWGDGTTSPVDSFDPIPDSTALAIAADHVYFDDGSYPVEVCVSPLGEGTECDALTVTVFNADPTFETVDVSSDGSVVSVAGSFGDPGADDAHTAIVDWGDGTVEPAFIDPATRTLFASHDFGATTPGAITITLSDDDGGQATVQIVDGGVAPVVGPVSGPADPVEVNTTVAITAPFADFDGTGDHTASIDWGDGTTTVGVVSFDGVTRTGIVSGEHIYAATGVYTVEVTVTDGDGLSGSDLFEFVVVYDPDGGFVTGGGWIDSPEGAYVDDPNLTGQATFGFVAKYKKGTTIPSGKTEFQFRAADLSFKSTEYEWLVVSGSGHRGQFKGSGTINGGGDYGFMVMVIDAANTPSTDIDLFRIKIWDKNDGDTVVYDNEVGADDDADPTTPIAGGSIVIHTGGNG